MSDSDSQKVLEDYLNALLSEEAEFAGTNAEQIDQSIVEKNVIHAGERKQVSRSVESANTSSQKAGSGKNKNLPNNVTDLRDHVSNQSSNAKDVVHETMETPQAKNIQRVSPVEPPAPKLPDSQAIEENEEPSTGVKEPLAEFKEPSADEKEPSAKIKQSSGNDKDTKTLMPEAVPSPKIFERPHEPLVPRPAERVQAQSHEEKLYQEQKILEAEKREQLQRLLSSQLTKTETKREPEVKKALTAQEKLEILAEQQKAALFRAKLSGKETAEATKQIVEETLRTTAEAFTPQQAPSIEKTKTEVLAPPVSNPAPEGEHLTDGQANITEELLEWGASGRPHWAEHPFEVLLFEVSGLSLAVPLVALGQIVSMSKKLTKLQGQSEWFMGILPSPVGDIRTINTAMFVMPERYDPAQIDNFKYVVTIDGLPWGLAVDQVNQPITLKPDDVKWRGERTKRPWLAGTVKSHMCALLDIPQMAHILEKMNRR